jgi:hypothetical protein
MVSRSLAWLPRGHLLRINKSILMLVEIARRPDIVRAAMCGAASQSHSTIHHPFRIIDVMRDLMRVTNSSHDPQSPTPERDEAPKSLTFLQMVGSILASFFGVQSGKNRERDFKHGKARAFIMVGVLMTIVWYATISLIVHVVLKR